MCDSQHSRTERLLGIAALQKLRQSHVAVFGIGGVGGAACEALARSGIGTLSLIDKDTVSLSNLNRQIIALHSTLGKQKVDVMRDRIRDIDPDIRVHTCPVFFLPETAGQFDFSQYDYVVDAVDTVTAKLQIIQLADAAGVPVISAMGTGNKLDPSQFEVADISDTSVCPLARVMRRELKQRGIHHLKVVYSRETPIKTKPPAAANASGHLSEQTRRPGPASVSFVPPIAGYLLAGEVIRHLSGV